MLRTLLALAVSFVTATALAQTTPTSAQPDLVLTRIGAIDAGRPAQMVFGPDGRLYVSIADGGTAPSVVSFAYDAAGMLTAPMVAVRGGGGAIGIGFGAVSLGPPGAPGTTSSVGMYLTDLARNGVSNLRVLTKGRDGVYGGPGGINTVIVQNIPGGYHQADQIIIKNDTTLYVGIGVRTSDGATGHPGRDSARDNAYGGTISQILDLRQVNALVTDSAGFGLTGDNSTNRTPDMRNAGPYTSTASNKLIVHSSGARNPFGLALDGNGDLWFTNNFSTTQANGRFDGTIDPATHVLKGFDLGDLSLPDKNAPDLKNNVYDQLFKAAAKGDYGSNNINWRTDARNSNPEATSPAAFQAGFFNFATHGVRSTTFDNLVPPRGGFSQYNQADINRIVGLGPGSSADGLAFYTGTTFPARYRGTAFVTRWTGETSDSTGHSVDYRDVVAVDVRTGIARQVAKGFGNPLAALEDGRGNILIADYRGKAIYRLSPAR